MLDKKYINKIKQELADFSSIRREVIKETGDALQFSKRAIFAMHRDNLEEAKEKLNEAEKIFVGLNSKYKSNNRLQSEGSYLAGLEEFVEATLFYQFLTSGKISEIKKTFRISAESYVAGICDVPGEMYRYAIKSATNRDVVMVKKCSSVAQEIVGELIEFNLTSYLRTKFDQAKGAVHKLEEITYQISMKE